MIQQSPPGSLGFATPTGPHASEKRSGAMQVAVLALNRNYQAVHVVSVRRAFCMLYKNLAEIIHCEQGQYVNYDFNSWQELSEMKSLLGELEDDEDWLLRGELLDSGATHRAAAQVRQAATQHREVQSPQHLSSR